MHKTRQQLALALTVIGLPFLVKPLKFCGWHVELLQFSLPNWNILLRVFFSRDPLVISLSTHPKQGNPQTQINSRNLLSWQNMRNPNPSPFRPKIRYPIAIKRYNYPGDRRSLSLFPFTRTHFGVTQFLPSTWTRCSSREVRIRVPTFSVVYFSRGTLAQKQLARKGT